ncbi:MAG: hypothetical protein KGS72_12650 [Cyanobacteria bacterium REEB67]|nr:hypothetical protein [Cyanobacteria bacterium REEB67]
MIQEGLLKRFPRSADKKKDLATIVFFKSEEERLSGEKEQAQASLKRAIELYDEAIKLSPSNVFAHRLKGQALISRADQETTSKEYSAAEQSYHAAWKEYDKALQLAPRDIWGWWGKCKTLTNRGDLKGKIRDYRCEMGSYINALACLQEAIDLAPNKRAYRDQQAYLCHKIALRLARRKCISRAVRMQAKAVAACDAAIELDAQDFWAYNNRLQELKFIARFETGSKAVSSYKKLADTCRQRITLNPDNNEFKMELANALYRQAYWLRKTNPDADPSELLQNAASFADQAAHSDKFEREATETKGRAFYLLAQFQTESGKTEPALASINRAIASYDKNLEPCSWPNELYLSKGIALWARARIEAKQSKREAALASFAEATKAFNACMDRENIAVKERYGRGSLLVDATTLQAKMSQGTHKPISFAQAEQAIDQRYRQQNRW